MSGARGSAQRLPVLDRLLDGGDEVAEPDPGEALRRAVLRDLEALLNARRRRWPLPPGLGELPRSPLGYGVPDVTSGSYAMPERRAWLAEEVERTILRFEPRLAAVHVTLHEEEGLDRTLRLRVEAVLRAGPEPEAISLETTIEAVSRGARVAERR